MSGQGVEINFTYCKVALSTFQSIEALAQIKALLLMCAPIHRPLIMV